MKTQIELFGLPTEQATAYRIAVSDVRKEIEVVRRKPTRKRPLTDEDLLYNSALDALLVRLQPQSGATPTGQKKGEPCGQGTN